MSQLKPFSAGSALPEGFKYQPDIIWPAEEEELLGRVRLRSERPTTFHLFSFRFVTSPLLWPAWYPCNCNRSS